MTAPEPISRCFLTSPGASSYACSTMRAAKPASICRKSAVTAGTVPYRFADGPDARNDDDSTPFMPRCIVHQPFFDWAGTAICGGRGTKPSFTNCTSRVSPHARRADAGALLCAGQALGQAGAAQLLGLQLHCLPRAPRRLCGRQASGRRRGRVQAEISWLDWAHVDADLLAFARRQTAFRHAYPAFRRRRWFRGRAIHGSGCEDIAWFTHEGTQMSEENWGEGHSCFARATGFERQVIAIAEQRLQGCQSSLFTAAKRPKSLN